MATEEWSWKKWFGGFIEGRRYGKDIAILGRFVVILFVAYLCIMGALWTKEKLFGEKPKDNTVINTNGAPVDNSSKKSFWSLINLQFGGRDDSV